MSDQQNPAVMYEKEQQLLRQELQGLKECQLKFLSLAVTVSGAVLGYVVSRGDPDTDSLYFLIPLIILLPSWWVFFDKAKSISRIVGFYRCIELLILERATVDDYRGWENTLETFRDLSKDKKAVTAEGGLRKWPRLLRTHRYLTIGYLTHLSIATLCIAFGWHYGQPQILPTLNSDGVFLLIGAALTALSAILIGTTVNGLMWGKHTYQSNFVFWSEKVLKLKERTSSKSTTETMAE